MQKIFYLPRTAMQKRKFSMKAAMMIATLIVFIATWLLHSYQWFWLVGRFPLTWVDAVFWGVFAILVMLNTAVLLRTKPKKPGREPAGWSLRRAVIHVLKVMGMFALMSAMFSWWSTRDPITWIYIMGSVTESGLRAQLCSCRYCGRLCCRFAGPLLCESRMDSRDRSVGASISPVGCIDDRRKSAAPRSQPARGAGADGQVRPCHAFTRAGEAECT